ncbi:YqgE/AlgH family protein [Marinospirillum sp.]|uniref:YqgE/AlgH family protein n=1 Tax=Marinospirillum sp. TaxID=2183934 RepID=UPI003A8617D2
MNTLRDHFLLSMPLLDDPHFADSLTYLCEHGEQGALGLIVNQPLELTLGELLDQMDLPSCYGRHAHAPIYRGGPVHQERGFVLHTGAAQWKSSLAVTPLISLTTSVDILEALAEGEGPAQFLIALGCAGWQANQLEQELIDNTWLTCPAWPEVLFDLPPAQRRKAAAQSLGVNLDLLTGQAGHA